MLFWPILDHLWCPVLILVTFSSNLSSFKKNPKNAKKNPEQIQNTKKSKISSKIPKKIKKKFKIQKIVLPKKNKKKKCYPLSFPKFAI